MCVCVCVCVVHVTLFVQVMSESVTGVSGGVVGSAHYEEVVVCTYSGRLIGLTREPQSQHSISQEVIVKYRECGNT